MKCNTVVIYFEMVQEFKEVPPLKNNLHTVCKIIHQHNKSARIFVANLLAKLSGSPLGRPMSEINFTLLQAVRSVNRAIGKVHYLSIYEHFISKGGRVIKPTHQIFSGAQLSEFGCMIFRECLMCEAGLKTYWFE